MLRGRKSRDSSPECVVRSGIGDISTSRCLKMIPCREGAKNVAGGKEVFGEVECSRRVRYDGNVRKY